MAFPTVDASTTSQTDPAGTTHNVSLPNGATPGKRLVVAINRVGDDTPLTWPSGWTQLINLDYSATAANPGRRCEVRYRDVTGSEGFTGTGDQIALTTSVARVTRHLACLIRNAARVPELAAASGSGNGTSTTIANPPDLAPSWGTLETLWVIFGCHNAGSNIPFTAPAAYGGLLDSNSLSNIALAHRARAAASEDPAAWSTSSALPSNVGWGAITLAIAPIPLVDIGAVMI